MVQKQVSPDFLDPAVTVAFAVRRNFPWRRVPADVVAQMVGGLEAALFLQAMFGTVGVLGTTCRERVCRAGWPVVGPVAGALIGVTFAWILKGKPTAAGATAAQGSLGVEDSTTPER